MSAPHISAEREFAPSIDAGADAPVAHDLKNPWRIRQSLPKPWYWGLASCGFLAAFAFWWIASLSGYVDSVFLPAPSTVSSTAVELLLDPMLWGDIGVSFMRVLIGFVISAVIAIPLGLLIGTFKPVEAFIQPFTEFVRYVPVPALIPILMVLFGIGEAPKWMLIFVGTYFQLVLMVADEIRRVPYEMLQVSYTLGAGRWQVSRRVMWRAAKPGIFDALRLCNGWAWTYLVIAELVAANEGLGFRVLKFSRFLQTPRIWVYLLILGVIGLCLDFSFRAANRRLFFWADTRAT